MAISIQTEELTPLRRGFILIASVLTVTLYFTSILVVSTVLPQIQGGMSATADEVSWIVTFNILAIAIATPMTGWLVARFGRKGVMCGCAGGFTAATLMCALAGSLESLIFWRIVQGAVGAPTVPLAQTILLDNYPKEKHQFVMGLNGIGVVLGPIIGPTVAGYIAEAYGWRWAFMLLIPVAATGFLALVYALPRDSAGEKVKLDWIGFLSLSTAVAGLQYVLARGHRLDWFESNEIILASLISALSFYVFLSHSLTAKQPFLNLGLLRNRNLALGYVLVSIFGMLNFTPMVLMPTLLRQYVEYPDALDRPCRRQPRRRRHDRVSPGDVDQSRRRALEHGDRFLPAHNCRLLDDAFRSQRHRAGDRAQRHSAGRLCRHDLRAAFGHRVLRSRPEIPARDDRCLPSGAQRRLELVHFDLRRRNDPIDRRQLRPARRVHQPVQSVTDPADRHWRLEHLDFARPCATLEGNQSSVGDDRLPEYVRDVHT